MITTLRHYYFNDRFKVVSTRMHGDIGREQFCAKLFGSPEEDGVGADRELLQDIVHCPFTNWVALCGAKHVKVIDEHWHEVRAYSLEKENEKLSSL
jgi:hypothetical protein